MFDTVLEGTFEIEHEDGISRYGPGDLFIANHPGAQFASTTRDIHVRTTTLPSALLSEAASNDSDSRPEPVEFVSRP